MNNLAHSPSETALALVQSMSLNRLIVDSIEEMILNGQLLPGEKLNEMVLAQRFGVSRGPLREALRTLEESGLIRQEKNRGAFVRDIKLAEAAEIYEVRAGMDATAGYWLATRITAAQLDTLYGLVNEMESMATSDADHFHNLNLAFHDSIVAMSGNTVLMQEYKRLTRLLTLFRRRNLQAPQAMVHFSHEHRQIVEALERGDATGAAHALFQHALGGRERMLADGELMPSDSLSSRHGSRVQSR